MPDQTSRFEIVGIGRVMAVDFTFHLEPGVSANEVISDISLTECPMRTRW